MSLTGNWTLVVLFALALGTVVATALVWNRVRGPGWVRWPARFSLIVACQLTGCLAVAAVVNDAGQFYTSWRDLFGGTSGVSIRHLQGGAEDRRVAEQLRKEGRVGRSLIASVLVPDAGDSRAQRALVYLPAAYFDPSYRDATFPVVELLDGFPGGPRSWTIALHIQRYADREISAHRSVPFIGVMPVQNYLGQHDAECVNAPGGPPVETTLTVDVHQTIERDFRADLSTKAWAVMGYSTGGYCALNIGMRHPSMFGAAVSLSGNASPYFDANTGRLFGNDVTAEHANDPLWLARHKPGPPIALLLAATRPDRPAYRDALALAAAARPPTRAFLFTLPRGGHSAAAFQSLLPSAIDWLSRTLPMPLALSVSADGRVPVEVHNPPAASVQRGPRRRPGHRLSARPRFQ